MPPQHGSTDGRLELDGCSDKIAMMAEKRTSFDGGLHINVREFKADLVASEKSLRVRESTDGWILPSPSFRSHAKFELHGVDKFSHLTVGYIQVVKRRQFRLVYTHGEAEWEFDGLPKDRAISDSDGRLLPFFGINNEIVSIRDNVEQRSNEEFSSSSEYRVEMRDQPIAKISWKVPKDVLPMHGGKSSESAAELRFVERHQEFCTWLAVYDHLRQIITPVVAVEWHIRLALDIDPANPIGSRTSWRPVCVEAPTVLSQPPPIPWTALHNTRTANMAEKLTWHPSGDTQPLVIVPAAECRYRVLSSPPLRMRTWTSHNSRHVGSNDFESENNSSTTFEKSHVVTLPDIRRKATECVRKTWNFARQAITTCVFSATERD